jgi:hypothetical protein
LVSCGIVKSLLEDAGLLNITYQNCLLVQTRTVANKEEPRPTPINISWWRFDHAFTSLAENWREFGLSRAERGFVLMRNPMQTD